MQPLPRYLQPRERAAVQDCIARLKNALGKQLRGIWLFGSKARDDPGPGSDIDLLIVISEMNWSWRDRILLIADRMSLEYRILLNTHILDQARWDAQRGRQDALWQQVQQGHVLLWQRDQEPTL
jgi:predicted nucleotidyltransferase